MAVTKRKDGLWAVVYRIDGKQRWEYFGRGAEGEKLACQRNEELINDGTIKRYNRNPEKRRSPSFYELFELYMTAKSIELPKKSMEVFFHRMTNAVLPEIKDTQAIRLTHERMRQYIAKRMKAPVYKRIGPEGNRKVPVKNRDGSTRCISKSTIHREISDIQAILNWSVTEGYIPHNPVQNFKKPTRDDEIIMPPTPGEVKKVLATAAPHLKRALILSYYTGLRPGESELFGLRWSDVDFDSGYIHITSAKKGGARDRLIPLHGELDSALRMWWDEDDVKDPLAHYLITYKGKPVASIKSAFKAAKRRAGITRRLRMYDFRHAFATEILRSGGDLKSASEMLGHTRTDTTTRVYQHTNPEQHRQNIGRLPSLGLMDDE